MAIEVLGVVPQQPLVGLDPGPGWGFLGLLGPDVSFTDGTTSGPSTARIVPIFGRRLVTNGSAHPAVAAGVNRSWSNSQNARRLRTLPSTRTL
jgi:hypothetical protein